MTRHLRNIPLRAFQCVLEKLGYKHIRTKGSHQTWAIADQPRPLILTTSNDPILEYVVRQLMRQLNLPREAFLELLEDCL